MFSVLGEGPAPSRCTFMIHQQPARAPFGYILFRVNHPALGTTHVLRIVCVYVSNRLTLGTPTRSDPLPARGQAPGNIRVAAPPVTLTRS